MIKSSHLKLTCEILPPGLRVTKKPLTFFNTILYPSLVFARMCCPCLSTVHQFGDQLVSRIYHLPIEWHIVQSLCEGSGVGDLSHRRSVGLLSMLYKVCFNSVHPLGESLPARFVPSRVTRATEALHEHALVVPRCRTEQYKRSFLMSGVRLWNRLPSSVFSHDSSKYQNLAVSAKF